MPSHVENFPEKCRPLLQKCQGQLLFVLLVQQICGKEVDENARGIVSNPIFLVVALGFAREKTGQRPSVSILPGRGTTRCTIAAHPGTSQYPAAHVSCGRALSEVLCTCSLPPGMPTVRMSQCERDSDSGWWLHPQKDQWIAWASMCLCTFVMVLFVLVCDRFYCWLMGCDSLSRDYLYLYIIDFTLHCNVIVQAMSLTDDHQDLPVASSCLQQRQAPPPQLLSCSERDATFGESLSFDNIFIGKDWKMYETVVGSRCDNKASLLETCRLSGCIAISFLGTS